MVIYKPYKIKLEYEDNKFSDDGWCDEMMRKLGDLKGKFIDMNCYLTKFYIYRIDKTLGEIEFFNKYMHDDEVFPKTLQRPSVKLYNKALEYLSEYKYESIKELAKKDEDFIKMFDIDDSVNFVSY